MLPHSQIKMILNSLKYLPTNSHKYFFVVANSNTVPTALSSMYS